MIPVGSYFPGTNLHALPGGGGGLHTLPNGAGSGGLHSWGGNELHSFPGQS